MLWLYTEIGILLLVFIVWLGLSIYFRLIVPGRLYDTKKSHIKIHLKKTTDFVKNGSGEQIQILTFPNKRSKEIILFLHGSAGRLINTIVGARKIGTVISPAYPGYAGSEGKPSTKKIYETVDVTMNYLHEKGYRDEEIVVLGHSMGGAPAVYAAVKYPNLKKVVLLNTFYSIKKICDVDHPGFCLLTYDVLNSGRLAPYARAKIRQFHSKIDKVVPYEHGKKLFEKLGSPDKKFFEIKGTHRFVSIKTALTKE